jgi:hypothetical protein
MLVLILRVPLLIAGSCATVSATSAQQVGAHEH